MAARKRKGVTELPESWKERIKTTILVNKLMASVTNKKHALTNAQVAAAKILLAKVAPDLNKTEASVRVEVLPPAEDALKALELIKKNAGPKR